LVSITVGANNPTDTDSSTPHDLTSQDPVLCHKIFVPQQEFLIDCSGDVGHHPRPKHLGFPLNLQSCESEIVDAVFQSEKSIRGEPVESCKLRYFNSFEFFDHTAYLVAIVAANNRSSCVVINQQESKNLCGSLFAASIFADRRISLQSQTEEPPPRRKKSF
jgi:hypothetical protein